MRILFAIFVFGIALSVHAQDRVETLAGQPLLSGATDGDRQTALFNDPASIVADAAGNLYIADSANHVIRKISTKGFVSTLSGRKGVGGFQDGASPLFNSPSGIAISASGEIFVSDTGNHLIRKITSTGAASTIAGAAGQSGATDANGSSARFDSPLGIAVSPNGTIYVADTGSHTIRAIDPNKVVTTIAGSPGDWGTTDALRNAARFNGPLGLALDAHGNLFVSDSNNHTIRKVAPDGNVVTWAGAPLADGFVNGDRLVARFSMPAELRFDSSGNLFIADSLNHAIRKISTAGHVTTVTGFSGTSGTSNGINGHAAFFNPYSLAPLPDGRLAVSDAYNQLIRHAAPPIEIQQPTSGNLSWNSIIGNRYSIQFTTNHFNSWTELDSVIATNTITVIGDPHETALKIYRVLEGD